MTSELAALVTLNQLPKIGPVRIRNLVERFGSAVEVLQATKNQVAEVSQCRGIAHIVVDWARHSSAAQELEECERHGIEILTPASPEWPEGLTGSRDAPVLLYVWGSLCRVADHTPVAVIGSRKTTHYGQSVTGQFSRALAQAGHTIISGLALGIDTIAHQSALEMGQRTIAVIGSGLAQLYPRQNKELAQAIIENGAVVSEYPLHTHPDRQTFPQRNRIVAAWAKGTLVTEMPERSGAMITAQFARDLGRPIYAIPGPIDRPSSEGCHRLIQEGAQLVTTPGAIIEDLAPSAAQLDLFAPSPVEDTPDAPAAAAPLPALPETEQRLYDQLTSQEISMEELHIATQIPIAELTITLLNLELQGLITQHPGMSYTRARV